MDMARVGRYSLALALIAGGVAAAPLAMHAIKERAHAREEARFAGGLSPCDAGASHLFKLLPETQADIPVRVLVFPSFARPTVLEVRAGAVDASQLAHETTTHPSSGFGLADHESAHLPPELYKRLVSALRLEAAHADTPREMPIDGTTYSFQIDGMACAMTNSPRVGTRAERVVRVVHALQKYAHFNGGIVEREAVKKALVALQEE